MQETSSTPRHGTPLRVLGVDWPRPGSLRDASEARSWIAEADWTLRTDVKYLIIAVLAGVLAVAMGLWASPTLAVAPDSKEAWVGDIVMLLAILIEAAAALVLIGRYLPEAVNVRRLRKGYRAQLGLMGTSSAPADAARSAVGTDTAS